MKEIKDTQITAQNVNFKIDPVVKESAESVLANMGLNMSAYIGMCLRQLAQDREIPFIQKADPEFWAAEYRAYKAKRIIDSGLISQVPLLYDDIKQAIDEAQYCILKGLIHGILWGDCKEMFTIVANRIGDVTFNGSLGDVYVAINRIIEGLTNVEQGFGELGYQDLGPLQECKGALESLNDTIVDGCYDLVLRTDGIEDLVRLKGDLPADTDVKFTRDEAVMLLDILISGVLDVYDEDPEAVTVRYTGQIGGSVVTMMLKSASLSRKALARRELDFRVPPNAADDLASHENE